MVFSPPPQKQGKPGTLCSTLRFFISYTGIPQGAKPEAGVTARFIAAHHFSDVFSLEGCKKKIRLYFY